MGKNRKVSIILPSLNVVDYISECIHSVVNQTLQDIEIICVDSGSDDGTLEIIKEYEQKDSRIRIIISDKKSYGHQMNLGIAAANGEYIGIVETDDMVPEEMYQELYEIAKNNRADFVKANYYDFIETSTGIKKKKMYLTKDASFYNRVINIEEEQECFFFPINTWTGIYNREFLQRHDICHNETPGASFQDNGFWFLTFAYAKRAFFLEKPYYMHRDDNPNSSIHSKKKVFCICDEFQFIRNTLKRDDSVFQKFKCTYTLMCFYGYMYHLERIDFEYKKIFLERFAKDFRRFYEVGELDSGKFEDGHILFSIMNSPERFYQQNIMPLKRLYDVVKDYDNIIIYGAGKLGMCTLYDLKGIGMSNRILCFAVTKKETNPSIYEGIPVYEIQNLTKYCEDGLVIIAVAQCYQSQIYETLRDLRFKHIVSISEFRES